MHACILVSQCVRACERERANEYDDDDDGERTQVVGFFSLTSFDSVDKWSIKGMTFRLNFVNLQFSTQDDSIQIQEQHIRNNEDILINFDHYLFDCFLHIE